VQATLLGQVCKSGASEMVSQLRGSEGYSGLWKNPCHRLAIMVPS
jgi:hypothetical protein